MLSGIGIGTGPANMPVISPCMASPRRSEITDVSASFMDRATGAAKLAHESMVPSTQLSRVNASASPAGGLNSQAVSSHKFTSLMMRRICAPSVADTLVSLPDALACCNASDLASAILMGPWSTAFCMPVNELRPPAFIACIIARMRAGSGNSPWDANCSRISGGSCSNCFQAISP